MILVIDNYDSFAYNLVQYVAEAVASPCSATESRNDGEVVTDRGGDESDVVVRRNDEVDVAGIRELDPDGVVVSPGPGTPAEAGVSVPLFAETEYPALGVCLGYQALCAAHGAPVGHAPEVVHGKPSAVTHDGEGVFEGLADPFDVGRYHSLTVERADLPAPLVKTARTDDERAVLMGVRHESKPHVGVQFHPESILTGTGERGAGDESTARSLDAGKRLIRNFVCSTT